MSLVIPIEELFADKTNHESWERVPLGEVATILNGAAFSSNLFSKEDGFPLIRIRDVARSKTETFYKGSFESVHIVKAGDLLIGMDGNFSCHEWKGKEALLNQRVCKILPDEKFLLKRFLFYGLNGYLKTIQDATSSVTVGHLSSLDVLKIPFPLPPLNEQRRIVEKLDELMGRLAAARAKLERVPRLLAHFRRAVLAAACSGGLTRDWRAENGGVEWETVKVSDLFDRGGIFDGPFGSNLKSSDYTADGVRVIRLENIGYLNFLGEKQTFISEEKYETLKRHTVGEGDLIFSSFIADNVRCCVLPKLEALAVAKADCFCLRPKAELVNVHFLQFQLSTRDSYDLLVENVHGATRPRINTTQLKSLEIPLPPLPEQREIVRRVNELFALADSLEARFAKAQAFFDRMPAAILAKAFRGELVPQNPDDEPAKVLLERLRAGRESANKPTVKQRQSASRQTSRKAARLPGLEQAL